MLAPDVVAPISSVTATSYMGWGGFVISLLVFAMQVWQKVTQRGKSLATLDGKLDRICEDVEEMKETSKVMDAHLDTLSTAVRDLQHVWKGPDGTNGAKSKLAAHDVVLGDHSGRLTRIERRNDIIDEIERRQRENYNGPERRQDYRRETDKEVLGRVLPEEREHDK